MMITRGGGPTGSIGSSASTAAISDALRGDARTRSYSPIVARSIGPTSIAATALKRSSQVWALAAGPS
jgi:hypothetical protein